MDAKQLAAAGFYFTYLSDVVHCIFCGIQVCHWSEGDDALKEHQRWSLSCGFVKGLCFGNIPVFLTTSLRNHLNSLPEVATCAGLISS